MNPFPLGASQRVLFEAHHPSHVLFAFALGERLSSLGGELVVVAQARREVLRLLDSVGLEARTYPRRAPGAAGAARSLAEGWRAVGAAIRYWRPDAVLSIAGTYSALPARRAKLPNALLTDTETATVSHMIAYPFADAVLHPRAYRLERDRAAWLSRGKRRFFDGHQETAYLSCAPLQERIRRYPTPTAPFVFIRAIAWQAYHEGGAEVGWKEVVAALRKLGLTEIAANFEGDDTPDLAPFAFRGEPLSYHAHLARAALVISEGATTATEATYYGTPVVYVNRNVYGTIAEAVADGRVRHAETPKDAARLLEDLDLDAWRARLNAAGPRRGANPLDILLASPS